MCQVESWAQYETNSQFQQGYLSHGIIYSQPQCVLKGALLTFFVDLQPLCFNLKGRLFDPQLGGHELSGMDSFDSLFTGSN